MLSKHNFAVVGVGGYIAPRHLEAIKYTNSDLVVGYDTQDSVGILDRHFSNVNFFKTFEEFSYFVNKFNEDNQIDYFSICSPNHMHKYHIAHALSVGAHAICEKPLVLNLKEIDELQALQEKYQKNVYTILQLRAHDAIKELKAEIENSNEAEKYEIELSYFTSRGPWYSQSWKANPFQSGGLPSNIGIHFFDMLSWIFGDLLQQEIHIMNDEICAGYIQLEKANVKWVLSTDSKYLPKSAIANGQSTYRSITYNGKEIEFSKGFTELHNIVYEETLSGRGFSIDDAKHAIKIVSDMKRLTPLGLVKNSHPILKGL